MTPSALLELQVLDSHIDLLRTRLPKLAEVVASASANAEVVGWQQRHNALQARIAELESAIASTEHESAGVATKRARLEQQLKTVIAPREAEALMHEIALMNTQRSALDDTELEAMDGLAAAEAQLAEHLNDEPRVRDAAAAAAQVAGVARAESEADIASSTDQRDVLRGQFDAAMLERYDSMRAAHGGVAIAKLNGLRCEGCHLDLSRGEVDDIKRLPADEIVECPNCGRLLVR